MCWLINKPISDTDKFLEVDEEGKKWRVNWAAIVVEPLWLELWVDTMGQKEGWWCKLLLLPGWRWDPLHVQEDYNPEVEDDVLEDIKPISDENMLVLVTLTVPHDLTKMTANLKGPFIINADTRKGCQVILDDDKYQIKFPIYDILKKMKDANEKKA